MALKARPNAANSDAMPAGIAARAVRSPPPQPPRRAQQHGGRRAHGAVAEQQREQQGTADADRDQDVAAPGRPIDPAVEVVDVEPGADEQASRFQADRDITQDALLPAPVPEQRGTPTRPGSSSCGPAPSDRSPTMPALAGARASTVASPSRMIMVPPRRRGVPASKASSRRRSSPVTRTPAGAPSAPLNGSANKSTGRAGAGKAK